MAFVPDKQSGFIPDKEQTGFVPDAEPNESIVAKTLKNVAGNIVAPFGLDVAKKGAGLAMDAVQAAQPVLEPLRTPTVGLGGIAAGAKAAVAGEPILSAASQSIEQRKGLGGEIASTLFNEGIAQDIASLGLEIATDPVTYLAAPVMSKAAAMLPKFKQALPLEKLVVNGKVEQVIRYTAEADAKIAKTEAVLHSIPSVNSPVPQAAININLTKLNTTDDVKRFISDLAEANSGVINEERRGVITHAETLKLAEESGVGLKDFLKHNPGHVDRAEILVAKRKVNVQASERAQAMAQAFANGTVSKEEAIQAYKTALLTNAHVSGITTETARALNSMKISVGAASKESGYKAILNARGGEGIADDILKKLATLDPLDIRGINKFIREVSTAPTHQKVFEAYVNGLLSGPTTHIANTISNTLTLLSRPIIERPLSAIADTARSLVTGGVRERFYGEAFSDIAGMFSGLKQAGSTALRAFIDEMPEAAGSKLEMFPVGRQAIKGNLGKAIRVPGRLLVAADEFFKVLARSGEAYAIGYREAMKKGISSKDTPKFISDFIRDMPSHITKQLDAEALYRTFQSELGPTGKAFDQLRRSNPAIKFFMPFLKTPINIAKFGLERTPLSLLKTGLEVRSGALKGGAISDQLAKGAMGSMITLGITPYVIDGTITGGGPIDPKRRAVLRAAGWQPYSIRIGNKYVSYQRLEPLAITLGLIADYKELSNVLEPEDALSKVFGSIAQNLSSKTFLQGISDLMKVMNDPERYGEGYAQKIIQGMVPNIVGRYAGAIDPVMRKPTSIQDAIKSRLPGMSQEVMALRDIWGSPVLKHTISGSGLERFISPVYVSQISQDRATRELVRLGISPGSPQRSIAGIKLTNEEYDAYAEQSGATAKTFVDKWVNSPKWNSLPDSIKEKEIKKSFTDARRIIRKILFLNKVVEGKINKVEDME